jgi:hypothetical protein
MKGRLIAEMISQLEELELKIGVCRRNYIAWMNRIARWELPYFCYPDAK